MSVSLRRFSYNQKAADVATAFSQGHRPKDIQEQFNLTPHYLKEVMRKGTIGAGLPYKKLNYVIHAYAIQKNLALWEEYSEKMQALEFEYSSKLTHLNDDYMR